MSSFYIQKRKNTPKSFQKHKKTLKIQKIIKKKKGKKTPNPWRD